MIILIVNNNLLIANKVIIRLFNDDALKRKELDEYLLNLNNENKNLCPER